MISCASIWPNDAGRAVGSCGHWRSDADSLRVGTYGAGLLELDLDGQLRRPVCHPESLGLAAHRRPAVRGRFDPVAAHAWSGSCCISRSTAAQLSPSCRRRLRPGPAASAYAHGDARRAAVVQHRGRPAVRRGPGCPRHRAGLPQLALPGRARMLLADARGDWVGGRGELLHSEGGVVAEDRLSARQHRRRAAADAVDRDHRPRSRSLVRQQRWRFVASACRGRSFSGMAARSGGLARFARRARAWPGP